MLKALCIPWPYSVHYNLSTECWGGCEGAGAGVRVLGRV